MKVRRSKNKKVRNATPLNYYGKHFKSKLELYCYKKLKEANLNFQYEAIRYTLVPNFILENDSYELFKRKGVRTFGIQHQLIRAITYTPDFVGTYKNSKKKFIIETKGNPNDAFPLRWKLFKRYIHDNKVDADIFMPRNQKQVDEVVAIIEKRHEELLRGKKGK